MSVRHTDAGEECRRARQVRLAAVVAGLVLLASPGRASAQTADALVDADLTVGAGATLANAIGDLTASVQARWVPDRLFAERGVPRRAANAGYRTARLFFVDLPQVQWLLVANHEVFGHGGRVRELFDGLLQFHIDPPWPYGRGGGVTFFGLDRDFTVHEVQAISIAGMEVNAVAAGQTARRAFAEREWTPRTALRYLAFELDAFEYIQKTSDEPERPGHDVSDFLELYNLLADATGAEPLTPRTLRRQSWISLANPMVASALVTIGEYLATGDSEGRIFAIPIGSSRVMPAARYRFTPFGPEWAVSGDVERGGTAAQVTVRVGRAPLTRPWAVAASYSGLSSRAWRVDVGLEVWRQPPLTLGAEPDFGIPRAGADLEWGGEVRARAEHPFVSLWGSPPLTLIVDAGLKTTGFTPGEPLGRGLVLRAGLGLPLIGRR